MLMLKTSSPLLSSTSIHHDAAHAPTASSSLTTFNPLARLALRISPTLSASFFLVPSCFAHALAEICIRATKRTAIATVLSVGRPGGPP
jgi:hypothetical protein